MSINRALLAVAAGGMGVVGRHVPVVFSIWSTECQSAITRRLTEEQIKVYCGGDFGNLDLIIILLAVCLGLLMQFSREIAEALHGLTHKSES